MNNFINKYGPWVVVTNASLIALVFVNCSGSYSGAMTDHFDGSHFFYNEKEEKDIEEYSRPGWFSSMKLVEWPNWIEDPVQPLPPKQVKKGEMRITYVNHATTLIQLDGVNILTDPIWSERASIVSWAGPKRVRAPGIKMKDLPRIDIILISHNHYDHLDIPTLKQLAKNHNPKIFVGLGVGELLRSEGLNQVIEMDWWQEYESLPSNLKIVFVPARHNSGRGLLDKNKTLWGDFVMKSSSGHIYFAGDTGYGEFLDHIKTKFGELRLALLPIGHYEPRWMMQTHHMNPDDAVKLHKHMNVKQSVGIHFGTFGGHNDEEVDAHEKDLQVALKRYGVSDTDFWVLGFGEGRDVP